MNWISGSLFSLCLLACAACGAPASEANADDRRYGLHYELTLHPDAGTVDVEVTLQQPRRLLREMSFATGDAITELSGNGNIAIADGIASWQPPEKNGRLSWSVRISHRRSETGYDALLNTSFGIFRAEDLIPRARSRALRGASSKTTMAFHLPDSWTVITEYSGLSDPIRVTRPNRKLSQPTGWIAAGRLGIRRDTLAGTRVAIAGPQGHAVRRMDMMALLNWTIPEINNVIGASPERLTIVSAGDPMWRGGLSAPASIFVHADRPLISENATSTLLHEVIHVALGIRAADGYDWIVEGVAEYYSLELLHRSGAITSRRHARALDEQSDWAQEAGGLCGNSSSGATTARATVVLRQLDDEIRRATDDLSSLDNVVASLRSDAIPIDLERLRSESMKLTGSELRSLHMDNLPGCLSIAD